MGTSIFTAESTANLVARVRRIIDDDVLRDSVTDAEADVGGTDSWNVGTPTNWPIGSRWDADDGVNEQVLVTANEVNPISVLRRYNGTAGGAHLAGAYWRKAPRFTYDQITDAIARKCNDLYPWCYDVRFDNLTPDPTVKMFYPLSADFERLAFVNQKSTATIPDMGYYGQGSCPISIHAAIPTGMATNRKAIRIPRVRNITNTIDVYYHAKLTSSTVPTGQGADVVAWGAAVELVGAKTVPLSTPDAQNVSGADLSRGYGTTGQIFEAKRHAWHLELLSLYPPAKVWKG